MTTFSRSGKTTGTTGAAQTIELGFRPDWIKLINESDAETIEWNVEMSALDTPIFGVKTIAAGARSILASAAVGIVVDEGDAEGYEATGFTIGATAGVNINAEELTWEAGQYDDPSNV